MAEPIKHHVVDGKDDPAANYSFVSILLHWLAAIAVLVLFVTHEDGWLSFHLSLGLVLTIPLIWRVTHRWSSGFPRPHDQPIILNFIARLVMIGFLVAIFLLCITGVLLPLFAGDAYEIFGIVRWQAPYRGNSSVHELLEEIHDIAGHVLIPLFALHILGFLKHRIFDKTENKFRMFKPERGGK